MNISANTGSSESSLSHIRNAKKHRKQLHRKIFLNTMRTVYPNSLRIRYEYSYDEQRYNIRPLSVQDKCKHVTDKVWVQQLSELNDIWTRHYIYRERVMLAAWALITFSFSMFITYGIISPEMQISTVYWAVGLVFGLLVTLIVPGVVFTFVAMRPMLRQFETWKRKINLDLDKLGIEIVKITSGEIVSDKSPHHLFGMLFYGSSMWFRYDDAEVEIFWRSVKSGAHVRRYSLMIGEHAAAAAAVKESKTIVDDQESRAIDISADGIDDESKSTLNDDNVAIVGDDGESSPRKSAELLDD